MHIFESHRSPAQMTVGVTEIAIQPYVVDVDDESLFSLDHLVSPQPVKQATKSIKVKKSKNGKRSSKTESGAGPFDVDSFPLYSPPPNMKLSTPSVSPLAQDDCSHLLSPDPSLRTLSESTFDDDGEEDSAMTPTSLQRQGRRRSSASRTRGFKIASLDVDENCDDMDASVHSKVMKRRSSKKKERRRSSGLSAASSVGSISILTDGEDSVLFSVGDFTASSKQSRRRRSSRKRVITFNKRTKTRAIPPLKSLTEEEKSMIWYREFELKSIKQDALDLLRQARGGSDDDVQGQNDGCQELCLRGLGSSLGRPGGPQNRRSNWMMALTCVLDEQQRQKSLGIHDPEHIAKLYRAFAVHSQHSALSTGRQDAKDVGANIPDA